MSGKKPVFSKETKPDALFWLVTFWLMWGYSHRQLVWCWPIELSQFPVSQAWKFINIHISYTLLKTVTLCYSLPRKPKLKIHLLTFLLSNINLSICYHLYVLSPIMLIVDVGILYMCAQLPIFTHWAWDSHSWVRSQALTPYLLFQFCVWASCAVNSVIWSKSTAVCKTKNCGTLMFARCGIIWPIMCHMVPILP